MLMLPSNFIMAAAKQREPDFIVKNAHGIYLRRWHIVERNNEFNVYLHNFIGDDDDRALHDHPYPNLSLILKGGYIEHLPGDTTVLRVEGEMIHRPPEAAHRIALHRDRQDNPLPAWTLFITGARVREWGFHCPNGWVPWQKFVAANDTGAIGLGCDQPASAAE